MDINSILTLRVLFIMHAHYINSYRCIMSVTVWTGAHAQIKITVSPPSASACRLCSQIERTTVVELHSINIKRSLEQISSWKVNTNHFVNLVPNQPYSHLIPLSKSQPRERYQRFLLRQTDPLSDVSRFILQLEGLRSL